MSQNKTKPTKLKVSEFIAGIEDDQKRADCRELMRIMREITGNRATMWGPSIVGFGRYHYKYASGREGNFFLTGFSPRKQALSIYVISGFKPHTELMEKLGKHKKGKSCLYVKRLADVDKHTLVELITTSVALMREKYPSAR